MAGLMYFGNRNYMQWVKCPDTGMVLSRIHWSSDGTYLNGGGYVRASVAGHLRYEMSWNLMSREQVRQIIDYRDGVFGAGPIYFLDPFVMDQNVLPQNWATPALAAEDGQPLTDERPNVIAADPTGGKPAQSAVYTLTASTETQQVWVPVPSGYQFYFAGLLSRTGTAAVTLTPTTGSAVNVTNTTPATLTSVGGGVTVSLSGVGTITMQGLMAKVLPTGTAASSTFSSGQGHSGCAFAGDPSVNGYSAVRDQLALSVTLKEVGAWDE